MIDFEKLNPTFGQCGLTHCLIVEDTIHANDIMCMFLERNGCAAETAENGKIALDRFCAGPE